MFDGSKGNSNEYSRPCLVFHLIANSKTQTSHNCMALSVRSISSYGTAKSSTSRTQKQAQFPSNISLFQAQGIFAWYQSSIQSHFFQRFRSIIVSIVPSESKSCHPTSCPVASVDWIPALRPDQCHMKPMPKYIILLFLSMCHPGTQILPVQTYLLAFFSCMDRPPRILTSCIMTEFLDVRTHHRTG